MRILKIAFSELLHVFGALWLLVEVVSYFSEKIAEDIKGFWWIFLAVGAAVFIYRVIPRKKFSYKIDSKDISIELVVGDIFKEKGSIVVGSNTSFTTSTDIISENSIQGIFTKKYFPSHQSVKDQISTQLNNQNADFGTTVTLRAKEKTGYFCAIAEINDRGVARSTIENIRVSLAELWDYLSDNGEKDIINIPILGSGFSRVSAPREDLLKEIVKSFIASIADHSYCEGLRIVIHPKDVKKYKIDIQELAQFIEYSCRYSLAGNNYMGAGTPES